MIGRVFDVKRFAVHDGGGIRTTLFLKGCPLRCVWCQNPEGLESRIRVWRRAGKCIACGLCAAACEQRAIGAEPPFSLDPAHCVCAGACVRACPTGALQFDGWDVSAEDAAGLLIRDKVFFGERGGATLSGGEVLFQHAFAREVLALVQRAGVDTAIETSMYASQAVLAQLIPVTDHFIVDIKLTTDAAHRRMTGVGNAQILSNYAFLARSGADILLRIPLIPGFTDAQDNVRGIARYARSVNPDARVELLNYNPLCKGKYAARGADYPVAGAPLADAALEGFYRVLLEEGIQHIVKE